MPPRPSSWLHSCGALSLSLSLSVSVSLSALSVSLLLSPYLFPPLSLSCMLHCLQFAHESWSMMSMYQIMCDIDSLIRLPWLISRVPSFYVCLLFASLSPSFFLSLSLFLSLTLSLYDMTHDLHLGHASCVMRCRYHNIGPKRASCVMRSITVSRRVWWGLLPCVMRCIVVCDEV